MSEVLETLPTGAGLNTPGVYSILTGDAEQKFYTKDSRFTGVITAPADFFLKKYADPSEAAFASEAFEFCDMLLTFSFSKGEVTFYENNSTDQKSTTITGKISINDDLEKLKINKDHKYSSQQLADVLKFNRRLFADPDECMTLVTNLKNFTADITQRIEAIDDKQGNKVSSYMHKVAHEVKLSFVLSLALINGSTSPSKFKVDVHFDLRDRAIEFWLESVELKEVLDDMRRNLVTDEVARFRGYIPTIELP